MSTRRRPFLSGPSKKISSWVRPGVCEVRASALRLVSALIRLDLPTLERPANATSMPAIGGSVSIEGEAHTNFHSPAKSFRPSSISFASMSALMRRSLFFGVVIPGRCAASNPESRDSGFTLRVPRNDRSRFLCCLLRRERGLDVVEQLHLHAVLAHD